MKRIAYALLAALLLASTVQAVNFTIDLTAGQIATITREYNERGGASSGFATAQLFFASEIDRVIVEYRNRHKDKDATSQCAIWQTWTTAQKNAACTAGPGGQTGCDFCR